MLRFSLTTFCLFITALTSAQNFSGESLEYDPIENRFFSSTNGSSIVQRAEDGTISFFGSGLQASYGMEVMNNTLFAIDGNTVYGYDLTSESEVMQISIAGAAFLNGMASDGNNRLWVTDFSAKRIHEIDVSDYDNPLAALVVANTLTTPNGIVYDEVEDRLIFVNWGQNAPVKQVSLPGYEVSTLVTTALGNIDGIDNDGSDNFYISSWSPNRITRYNSDFSVSEIITAPGISSPADICYAQPIDTLAIPNGNNTVTFVGFSSPTSILEPTQENGIVVAPNPINEHSSVTFQLTHTQPVKISVVDVSGKEILLHSENMSAGKHRVLLTGFDLAPGQYILKVIAGEQSGTQKIIVP